MSNEIDLDVIQGMSIARSGLEHLSSVARTAYHDDNIAESRDLMERINRNAVELVESMKRESTRLVNKNAWRLGK